MSEIHAFFDNNLTQVAITVVMATGMQILLRNSTERLVRRAVQSHKYSSKLEEQKREETIIKVFHTAVAVVVWAIAAVTILFQLDINVAGLLTGAGLIGVIATLGAQNSIKDFLAGTYIILENQYRVGDVVNLSVPNVTGGVSGVIEDITLRITKLRDMDGSLRIVSNGSITAVANMTFQYANVNLDIPVSYDTNIEKVKKIINQLGVELAGDEALGTSVIEAIQFLRVDSFGPSTVTIKALGKVKPGTQWDVAGEFRLRLKAALSKHNIETPLPQLVVHEDEK